MQIAVPELRDAAEGADLLVFVVPHQFIRKLCDELASCVSKTARGITLIKVKCNLTSKYCSCWGHVLKQKCYSWEAEIHSGWQVSIVSKGFLNQL